MIAVILTVAIVGLGLAAVLALLLVHGAAQRERAERAEQLRIWADYPYNAVCPTCQYATHHYAKAQDACWDLEEHRITHAH